jgi:hypothetical protein
LVTNQSGLKKYCASGCALCAGNARRQRNSSPSPKFRARSVDPTDIQSPQSSALLHHGFMVSEVRQNLAVRYLLLHRRDTSSTDSGSRVIVF